MRIKGLIIIFLLIIIGAGWAEYEIELVSETTFQGTAGLESLNISEYNSKLYFYSENLYCIDGNELGIVAGFPAGWTISNSTLTPYNNNLYCIVGSVYRQLGSYNGTEFNLIDYISPGDYGIDSSHAPIVCNGKLYFSYRTTFNQYYHACYDGTNISLIDEYSNSNYGRFVYNNKLYYSNESNQVKSYNGVSSAVIPHPVNGVSAKFDTALEYNGKLYFKYECSDDCNRLAVYDDSDASPAITLLYNPACNGTGMESKLFLCDDKLYYYSDDGSWDEPLTRYDTVSESFTSISSSNYGSYEWNTSVLNDELYSFVTVGDDGVTCIHLDGTSFEYVTEPVAFFSFGDKKIAYDDKLFFSGNSLQDWELYTNFYYLDYDEIFLINSPIGTGDFVCIASEHFDKLYLVYHESSAGSRLENYCFATCQEVEDDPMPVELSSFNCSLCDGIPLLQWTTMSEINNAGWNIYFSASEEQQEAMQVNCEMINGHGTTSQTSQYSFYDQYSHQPNNTYYYWLESIDFSGNSEKFGPITLFIPEENEETPEIPSVFLLKPNSPNPFNPTTTIFYDIAIAGNVELNIYNAKGQLVETLVNEYQEPDYYSVVWQADDQSSGMYYYQLKSMFYNKSHKMLLLK